MDSLEIYQDGKYTIHFEDEVIIFETDLPPREELIGRVVGYLDERKRLFLAMEELKDVKEELEKKEKNLGLVSRMLPFISEEGMEFRELSNYSKEITSYIKEVADTLKIFNRRFNIPSEIYKYEHPNIPREDFEKMNSRREFIGKKSFEMIDYYNKSGEEIFMYIPEQKKEEFEKLHNRDFVSLHEEMEEILNEKKLKKTVLNRMTEINDDDNFEDPPKYDYNIYVNEDGEYDREDVRIEKERDPREIMREGMEQLINFFKPKEDQKLLIEENPKLVDFEQAKRKLKEQEEQKLKEQEEKRRKLEEKLSAEAKEREEKSGIRAVNVDEIEENRKRNELEKYVLSEEEKQELKEKAQERKVSGIRPVKLEKKDLRGERDE